ncbi:MAG: xanthine dehydrogenase family protein molybdopterin-binding subunit [Eubacteriales bacterium]
MMLVGQGIKKKDADALVMGKPVYTDDLADKDCLVLKLLRSPHAHAIIKKIDVSRARALEGVECVLTWEDVPHHRFSNAGQSYPEPSPYDRLILDQKVRYVGDEVAIVAAVDERTAQRALELIRVEYEVLEPVLDFEKATSSPIVIHDEEDFKLNYDLGGCVEHNLLAAEEMSQGDMEAALAESYATVEETYYTKANAQAMMETFRTYTYLDRTGRLAVVSSTQTPFHARRCVANALGISPAQVNVIKPRIGGGFGAKQTMVSEVFPAVVTWLTGKPAKLVYTRHETMIASNSRHQMRLKVRLGCDKEGNLLAAEVCTLSNTGAYGEHGSTTVGLSGSKTLALCNHAKAIRFAYEVVYTNTMPAGAYRGYGATQGFFAVESAINQLAAKIGMDPLEFRLKNLIQPGEVMFAYYGETLSSCGLGRCLQTGAEMIGWKEKGPVRDMGNGKLRALGMAQCMQGSSIAGLDTASVRIKLNEFGFYTLMIGATDMGTGCDTILAQMAADILLCPFERINTHGVETDVSPYDCGSYASSTTYLTGIAVVKAANELVDKLRQTGADMLEVPVEQVEFDGDRVYSLDGDKEITVEQIAVNCAAGQHPALEGFGSYKSPISPPPFMSGFVEIELDTRTGRVEVLDMVGVVDCGTVVNSNLARVQTEGGLAQGIGMALYEDVIYDAKGRMETDSFLQYKIPTRMDVGTIRVAFEETYEKTGPFGAKSIGEVVINTPAPAIAHALYNATGVWFRELPITPEKILRALREKQAAE